jgi:hypothetical protein
MQVYWNMQRYYRDYCIFVIARNPLFLNFIIVYYSVIAWNYYFYNRDWHLGQVIDLATKRIEYEVDQTSDCNSGCLNRQRIYT